MKNLLPCDMKCHAIGESFTRTEVAGIAWMGAAGNYNPDTVPLAEAESRWPEFDAYAARSITQRTWPVRANPDIAVADIRRAASGSDVAEYEKEVCVFEAGAEKQLRRHRPDHIEVGVEGLAGEKQDVRSAFEQRHVSGRDKAAQPRAM